MFLIPLIEYLHILIFVIFPDPSGKAQTRRPHPDEAQVPITEELGHAGVDEEGRQGDTDNPVGPGMEQSLMEKIPDLFEIS